MLRNGHQYNKIKIKVDLIFQNSLSFYFVVFKRLAFLQSFQFVWYEREPKHRTKQSSREDFLSFLSLFCFHYCFDSFKSRTGVPNL